MAHELGRQPSGYIILDNESGNVVYRTHADKALATPSSIFLRSYPSASFVTMLVG